MGNTASNHTPGVFNPAGVGPQNKIREAIERAVPLQCPRFYPAPDGNISKVIDVYDGDTVTLLCFIGNRLFRCAARLNGIDCPELRGRGEKEKKAAIGGRDYVRSRILNTTMRTVASGRDKYGRMRVELFEELSGNSFTEELMRLKMGRAYIGDTRRPFTDQA